ncbi:MAG: aminotransferase class I/II-fold pyridoxal phosphate-dependent enzyme [Clostridia bacterium]|nr:aminotransferase class I/II-fold pyridoxal phosphate-dependent enzyme [Clostridia bacterium]
MIGEERLNAKARSINLGAIREVFDKASKMENVINMGIGEPNQDTHLDICRACADALMHGKTHYAPNAGIPQLRKALSENGFIAKNFFNPDTEIMVTNGGMGAFALIMQCVLTLGDQVLIQDPQYLNFKQTINLCGGIAVPVPTTFESGFCMKAEDIRKKYVKGKTKILIINSPNNPTGEVIPKEKLAEIAKVACELDLLVISDEVYGSLIYDNAEKCSIVTFPGMKERTIVVGSFSKGYAMTGWRIGYLAGPEGIVNKMIKVQEYFNSCINTSAQYGATFALKHPEFEEEVRQSFAERREIVLQGFDSIQGIKRNNPKGAFYLFPDIKSFGMDSVTFCNKLLDEAKVVCTPGSAFGECGEGFMRVAYTAEKDKLLQALDSINAFCLKYKN